MTTRFQAIDHELKFGFAKFENVDYSNVVSIFMNVLGCLLTRDMVFIEYKIVHINATIKSIFNF